MRWQSLLTLIASLFLLAGTLAAPASIPGRSDKVANLEARQEPDPTTNNKHKPSEASPTETEKDVSKTATDASTTAEATTTGNTASTTALTTATTHATATDTAAAASSTIPSLDGATTSSQKQAADSRRPTYSGGLPIKPTITPAWGVGGFILLALGAVLAFIGVRKQWVQIFLSTGLLSALGVTVLIIYLMSPPVSNAVQGGYLVAVFFTGAVFGALSLVFREICEGLGCLLGGFCLSMWFLALKSGGLLTENGPKAGMIIAFTVGFYSLSFSHYTRAYGLIGCTSFSGATALVLGVDCYSRAGLKEFWLYIWGLNDNAFPLRTDTYPVTRGIRVELAATIMVAVLGVISQMRLWNVIKERRAKEENSRLELERKIEEEDAEVGRRLEEKNIQERAEWELMYGGGKATSVSETAVGDSRRGSDGFTSSDNEKELEGDVELQEMQSPDISDCEKRELGENDNRGLEAVPEEDVSQNDQSGEPSQDQRSQKEGHREEKMPRPVTPVVTHVLGEVNDDSSEIGADIGSEVGTPRSNRLSGRGILNRLSWRNSNGVVLSSQSQEALVARDDNSSVLGVVDDLHEMSVGCPSVIADTEVTEQELTSPEAVVDFKDGVDSQAVQKAEVDCNATTAQQHAEEVSTEQHSASRTVEHTSSPEKAVLVDRALEESKAPEPTTQLPSSENDEKVESVKQVSEDLPTTAETTKTESITEPKLDTTPEPLVEQTQSKPEPETKVIKRLDASAIKSLPEQTSRMIHSYRTNEWAKHLANADTPEMEPIFDEPEPEAEDLEVHETPAVVDVDGLLQTPLTAQPPPVINRPEVYEVDSQQFAYVQSAPPPDIPRPKTRNTVHGLITTKPSVSRNNSTASVNMVRSSSGLISAMQQPGLTSQRSTSTPLLTITTVNNEEPGPSPRWSGPPPLLAVRENRIRNRLSSTSNRYDPWASRNQSRQSLPEIPPIVSPISPPLSVPEERDEHQPTDEDDIPLSKRRALLQRQTMESPSAASLHSLEGAHSPVVYPAPAHAGELNRSASRMAAWRQSVREELYPKRDSLALQSPPLSPNAERPRTWGSVQQMREASSAQLGNAIAEGMQRGNMTDLHRQAMRRMQASANRLLPLSREAEPSRQTQDSLPRSPTHAPVESTPFFVRAQRRQCVPLSGPPSLLRPPAVRLVNPVNYVPRITPITVLPQHSDESLALTRTHSRDAHPLLSIPERRRSRLTPTTPSSLHVERSQGETESGRTSIALPRHHRRSEPYSPTEEMAAAFAGSAARETENLRPPEAVHLSQDGTRQNDRPRHAQSQTSLRSQSQIAAIPSNTGQAADVAEELAWGPAHPCFPHVNPHVPIGSREHMTTRIIRIKRDWMIKGDLAPTFSNLYPEILDPLLSEQEFRRVISTVNEGIIKAFDPFSLRNWFDGAMGLLTGWVWDDINAPATKHQLQKVEDWLENWNREVGDKEGVHIWSLRRTAYMSLDIQIPDPKVGIVPSEAPSAPNTRPSTGIGGG
ncbi:uncharacterized protein N7515_000583 [Penicillium bovifimosum]|uniref:Ras modification protein ERF4 n=1 Tax=Penicillium bovifimosum TaxID=126998 RepID=A0A9W9LA05_9EURO|nr:uncharacterized protein N7515_000583 [Penicillium bovifimosum]KAJ5146019.1 hypothetical protein N7515_000583 [Penicillium bovifimosum]